MSNYIAKRVIRACEYIISTNATVRETAKIFNYSKSTIHKDVSYRVLQIDKGLADKVAKVLEQNLEERHVRGGEATRRKYLGVLQG